ncbi:unnamed protein product [Victoria cruziana]
MDLKAMQRFLPYAVTAIIITFSLWSRPSRRSGENSERTSDSNDGEADAHASSSRSVREDGFQYDVFLSFRGPDTRKTFTDLLYVVLKGKGVVTFIDSDKLEKGKKVEKLFECIDRSKIFVPIFSKGYADSEWCLQEIATMVECKRLILPVFIDVEPRDVRNQSGPFAPAFGRHRKNKKINKEEVSKWSDALAEAGKVSGYTLATTDGYEGKLIQVIVKRILIEVNKTPLFVAKYQIGLDSRIADVIKILQLEAQDDVRMVGIHGMGGMGKTTLAKAVYNQISSCFDACSFLSNVRVAAEQSSGLVSLQKQLLSDVCNDEDVKVSNESDGIGKIRERVRSKKVLLVLDDVDNRSQIDSLVGSLDWFGSGSRIIITTRDKRMLTTPTLNQSHLYELRELDPSQSLQLFSWHAFGKDVPDTEFEGLSKEVTFTAAGLPLALEVFGSLFFDLETTKEWKIMLERLKEDQDKDIHKRLRISFDTLDEKEKQVFLDIACFFVGKKEKNPTLMWEGCDFLPDITIKVLIHKSLVSINEKTGKFEMHDHIRDMGRKIVQAESNEVEHRSRLWKEDEIVGVLQSKSGTRNIEAIDLSDSHSVSLDEDCFAAMSKLRMLRLNNEVKLNGENDCFPHTLRWLQYESATENFHPLSGALQNIVVLDLSRSSITQLWKDPGPKVFDKLRVLNLSHCGNLTTCLDFRSMPHLERLNIQACYGMDELHPSIGCLESLTHLNLSWNLFEELPQELWRLTSLEGLNLHRCSQLTSFPSQLGNVMSSKQPLLGKLKFLNLSDCSKLTTCPDFTMMPRLEILNLSFCGELNELHPSIGLLKSLTHLSLVYCISLKELPQEVWQLSSVEELDISYTKVTTLPSQLGISRSSEQLVLDKLKVLKFKGCDRLTVCPDFTSMPCVEELYFNECIEMKELHPSIGQLKNLTHLDLGRCKLLKELPQEFWHLTSLEELCLSSCHRIITTLPSESGDSKSLKQPLLDKLKALNLGEHENILTTCPDVAGRGSLTSFPNLVGNLKNLGKLDLSYTDFEELPDSIVSLENLEFLSVAHCYRLKFLPASASIGSIMLLKNDGISSVSGDEAPWGRQRYSLIQFPPSLTELCATACYELEMIADLSNAKGLNSLYLNGCQKLLDVPGVEQLKQLKSLELGGCRSLSNSLRKKIQEANFEHLDCNSVPGILGELSDAQSLSFLLPQGFNEGMLFLKLDDCSLDNAAVHVSITKDDEQLLFQTSLQPRLWRTGDSSLRPEVPKVDLGADVEALRNDSGMEKIKIMMHVTTYGRLLLDGYFFWSSHYGDMYDDNVGNTARVSFGGPFHQYDGPVVAMRVHSGSYMALNEWLFTRTVFLFEQICILNGIFPSW